MDWEDLLLGIAIGSVAGVLLCGAILHYLFYRY